MKAIAVATKAALAAGQLILRSFHQAQEIRTKGPQDIVTQVDIDAEDIIVATIRQAFPDHQFLGEEGHTARLGAENLWVIDPLDGTRNYSLGIPFFCVSVALARRGKAILGVVYDPVRGELFSAEAGEGTYVNGERVQFTPKAGLDEAIVYVGFLPAQNPSDPGFSLPMFLKLRPLIAAMRNMGSAALSLAYVACGRLDIAYHDRLSPWDLLAGAFLIKEAGGVATDFKGGPITVFSRGIIAATGAPLHAPVLRIAQQVIAGGKAAAA
jgi:myo-inositol-1(or 4)-monophosphatase